MKINIKIVATPLIIAERLLAVDLNSGFKYPAYNADNTPTVIIATATIFIIKTLHGKLLLKFICATFLVLGITMLSLIEVIPPFEKL